MIDNQHKHKGFSLIELIITLIIFSVISVVIGKVLLQNYLIFSTSENITEADWQGFIALQRLTDDIHNIRSAASMTTIGATNFAFTDVNGTSISYTLSGTSLMRNSQVLASGVSALNFAYTNASGATTATASAVRYVSISLTETQKNLVTNFTTLVGTRGMY